MCVPLFFHPPISFQCIARVVFVHAHFLSYVCGVACFRFRYFCRFHFPFIDFHFLDIHAKSFFSSVSCMFGLENTQICTPAHLNSISHVLPKLSLSFLKTSPAFLPLLITLRRLLLLL